jgi:hypothetical protein
MTDHASDFVAQQIALGRVVCQDLGGLADLEGARVYSIRRQWSAVRGEQVRKQHGVYSGWEGRSEDLTVRRARRNYLCADCSHIIPKGPWHGSAFYSHYCPCCTAAADPGAVFTPTWPPQAESTQGEAQDGGPR